MAEYVDLGLPSGTLWQASDTDGWFNFNEAWSRFGNALPTQADWHELIENCDKANIQGGVVFKSKRNGKTIILHHNGHITDKGFSKQGTDGFYWSCSPYMAGFTHMTHIDDDGINIAWNCRNEDYANSVRLVKK